jgi:hypothetical protein
MEVTQAKTKANSSTEGCAASAARPAADQAQFDRELAELRKANAAVYAKRTPWKRK